MTDLQKKWFKEGLDAIDTLKNAIDVLRASKIKAAKNQVYDKAVEIRDMERALNDKLLSLFEIKIKNLW